MFNRISYVQFLKWQANALSTFNDGFSFEILCFFKQDNPKNRPNSDPLSLKKHEGHPRIETG